MAIPDVLAHGKSYERGFMKKYDGHKLCMTYEHDFMKKREGHKVCTKSRAESSFDWFLCAPSLNSMGSRMSTVSQKNSTVINFARCHAHSRVSIGFSYTTSEIQNTCHSR
ncbi:hypothetical protein BHE74_00053517 [Ensete ventricosum]|nr:hypothetical protein BHE74_00053517 [Ensete ventricosum]